MSEISTAFNRKNIGAFVLMEILSVSPIFMILGNILPPIGLKIHHYAFGIAFLAAVYHLAFKSNKKWLFYVLLFYLVIQFFYPVSSIKTLIDFFFGPFILVAISTITLNKELPPWMLKKYRNRLIGAALIPLIITVLQFVGVVPITFLAADFINSVRIMGVETPRPNGFLYHGSEIAVIIYFLGIMAIFLPTKKALRYIFILLIVAATSLFKAIFATTFLLLIIYIVFLDKTIFYHFKLMSRRRLFSYLSLVLLISLVVFYMKMAIVYKYTGYLFEPTMLTGRGSIWNIYFEGIQNFTFWNYLFGSGMGSEFSIFAKYATPENFYPLSQFPNKNLTMHTHNSLLSIFINSGLAGLMFVGFLFYVIRKELSQKFSTVNLSKFYFVSFLLPFLLIGVTIPIVNKAIYWVMLGFVIVHWSLSEYGLRDAEENA